MSSPQTGDSVTLEDVFFQKFQCAEGIPNVSGEIIAFGLQLTHRFR